jgi:DNA-binding response OmpR family regulator
MTITEGGAANRGVRILLEAVRESARRAGERSVLLLETRSAILTRPELAGHAWGPDFTHRHTEVEVYVNRLRRKLDRAGAPALIETVHGRGYRLLIDD